MLEVEVTPRAAIQLEAAATWWANNRPTAPDAIRVDFQQATALLSRQPGVGAKSSTARYPDLREKWGRVHISDKCGPDPIYPTNVDLTRFILPDLSLSVRKPDPKERRNYEKGV